MFNEKQLILNLARKGLCSPRCPFQSCWDENGAINQSIFSPIREIIFVLNYANWIGPKVPGALINRCRDLLTLRLCCKYRNDGIYNVVDDSTGRVIGMIIKSTLFFSISRRLRSNAGPEILPSQNPEVSLDTPVEVPEVLAGAGPERSRRATLGRPLAPPWARSTSHTRAVVRRETPAVECTGNERHRRDQDRRRSLGQRQVRPRFIRRRHRRPSRRRRRSRRKQRAKKCRRKSAEQSDA